MWHTVQTHHRSLFTQLVVLDSAPASHAATACTALKVTPHPATTSLDLSTPCPVSTTHQARVNGSPHRTGSRRLSLNTSAAGAPRSTSCLHMKRIVAALQVWYRHRPAAVHSWTCRTTPVGRMAMHSHSCNPYGSWLTAGAASYPPAQPHSHSSQARWTRRWRRTGRLKPRHPAACEAEGRVSKGLSLWSSFCKAAYLRCDGRRGV